MNISSLAHSIWSRLYKYIAIISINYRSHITGSLADLLSHAPFIIIRTWIFAQLYSVTYHSGHQASFGDTTLAMTIWILMILQVCFVATLPLVSRTVEEEITTGSFTSGINKPYSYMLFHYAAFIGRLIPTFIINILIGAGAAFLLVGLPPISLTSFSASLILLSLGFSLNFLISFSIGLLSFWIKETMPITWLYWKGETIFGGYFIPIALMPPVLQVIAEILPFSHVFYNGAYTFVNFEKLTFLKFLAIQCGWIILFLLIALYLLKKGTDRVLTNGG